MLELAEKVDMVVIHPGLSLNEETQLLVKEFCVEIQNPLLIDGVGIAAVANNFDCIVKRDFPTVLTLHADEMAALIKQKIGDILQNKIGTLQDTCQKLNATIVLKGAPTLIGYPDKRVLMNFSGNSGMASTGSDDISTGVIAAMARLGFAIDDAVRMGVFVHGYAGDLAAQQKDEDGLIACDIMEYLSAAMKSMRDNFENITQNFYQTIFVI